MASLRGISSQIKRELQLLPIEAYIRFKPILTSTCVTDHKTTQPAPEPFSCSPGDDNRESLRDPVMRIAQSWLAFFILSIVSATSVVAAPHDDLHNKLVVGFQGWFMCPGDGRPGGGGWVHWFTQNKPNAAHFRVDLMPDTSELQPNERCPTALTSANGPIYLFSDQNPKTVLRQFQWMQQYGIDAAALQRFVVGFDPVHPVGGREVWDRVLDNTVNAADATDRGIFVMYDIAGADPARWADVLADDWQRLLSQGITRHPGYQRHKGRPVLAIAGVGSSDRPGTASQMIGLVARLRSESKPFGGVTLIATTATGWRTLSGDAKHDPAWAKAYASFDILSPWTVGRYHDARSFDEFVKVRLAPDIVEAHRLGLEYIPVIFPGFSWHNAFSTQGKANSPYNQIPRDCGRFLWMQAARDRQLGADMLYGAMFDEVDEGTALFKLAPPAEAPREVGTVSLDADQCRVPSDWYLRVAGEISKMLKASGMPALKLPISP